MGLAAAVPEVEGFEELCPEQRDAWFGYALREANRALSHVVALIDSVERTGSFHDDGHASPAAWVKAVGNTSTVYARDLVAMARALRALPTVAEEFVGGALGLCQVRELIKLHRTKTVRDHLAVHEELMLDNAQALCFDDFSVACQHFRAVADPDGVHRSHERAHDSRNVTTGTVGEEFVMNAHTGTNDGAKMMKVLDAFTQTEFEADMVELRERCGENAPTIMMRRTHAQRRADALVKVFETAATSAGVVAPGEAIVDYVIDDATWKREIARLCDLTRAANTGTSNTHMSDDEMGERLHNYRCETESGIPVDPRIVIAAALNGRVRRIVTDPRGIPVDIGRLQRFFDGPLRDALQAMFRRCVHPGCDIPAHQCQIDHLTEYTTHGATAAGNAGPLCGRHNRWKHDHQQSVWLDPGGQWHIYRDDGTEIAPRYNPGRPNPPC